MTFLSLFAFAFFAVVDWVAVAEERKAIEYVAKPAALGALLIYATAVPHPFGWLIVALALSLLGDVYLMLPADLFVAGLSAFLLAHLAYVAAFEASVTARAAWLVVTLAASAPLAARIMRAIREPPLRAAVALYMLVISMMVASAFASGSVVAVIGAVLFFVSDTIIAWNRFVRPLPWAQPAIMITYHLGQLGLATALRTA